MPPKHLHAFIEKNGVLEQHSAGQLFHAQDFAETMFMVKSGYVKRSQITKENNQVIELIYGPSHLFPLTQLYRKVFSVQPNQQHLVYVYQAMTNVEIWRISAIEIEAALQKDLKMYIDLYYECGLRLKANIDRLASNAIHDDYKKVAHQLICLADDFGSSNEPEGSPSVQIDVPLTPNDMAEQLNISTSIAEAVMGSLTERKLVAIKNNYITIPDVEMLKDIYL